LVILITILSAPYRLVIVEQAPKGEGEVYILGVRIDFMSDSVDAEIAYKCDLCGELFNSEADAQSHNRKAHADTVPKGELESQVTGTSTPAEDREEERAK
jgi:uncharacterized C2H2 Zn-finger protein